MKKRIKVNGVIIFVSALAIIIFPWKFLRSTSGLGDDLMKSCGMVLILFGLLLRIVSRGFKAEHSQGGHSLVLGGPYTLVRNPMYLGIFCAALGVILSLFHWWALLIFILFFVSRYIPLIAKEEKFLMNSFGQKYADYQKEVPRLIPRFSALINKNVLSYLPLKLSWVKKEKSSVFILLGGTLAIECLMEIRFSNLFFFLPYFISLMAVIGGFIGFSFFLAKHYESIPK